MKRIRAIYPAALAAIIAQNEKNAVELVTTMKGFVPVDDGVLQSTIKNKDVSANGRITQRISAGGPLTTKPVRNSEKGNAPMYDYALAQEHGTTDQPASPFFWPAWRLKRRKFRANMNRAAKKAVQGAIKK